MATSELPPFFDRRQRDRRLDADPCRNLPVDLFHRKRRKRTDRRQTGSLYDDYYGYLRSLGIGLDQGKRDKSQKQPRQ